MVRVFGTIGLNGSGKDTVIEYISSFYGVPMLSIGDLVREIAMEKQILPTRENLTMIATDRIAKFGAKYFPSKAIERIERNRWEVVGVAGIRTYDDVRVFKRKYGDDFLLIFVNAPLSLRYEWLIRRGQARDPRSYDEFVEQDRKEEQNFSLSRAIKMADVKIENNLGLEHLYRQVDRLLERTAPLPRSLKPSWFLVGTTFCQFHYGMIADREYMKYEPTTFTGMKPFEMILRNLKKEVGERTAIPIHLSGPSKELDYMSLFSDDTILEFDSYLISDNSRKTSSLSQKFLLNELPTAIPRTKNFILVGPDHSISVSGVKKALMQTPDLGVVIFDKHLDAGRLENAEVGQGNFVPILGRVIDPGRIAIVGPCVGENLELASEFRAKGYRIHVKLGPNFDVNQIVENDLVVMREGGMKHIYISVDVDSIEEFSTTYFPTGSAPFKLGEMLKTLSSIKRKWNVIAGDVCGFTPRYRLSDSVNETQSSLHVASTIRCFIS